MLLDASAIFDLVIASVALVSLLLLFRPRTVMYVRREFRRPRLVLQTLRTCFALTAVLSAIGALFFPGAVSLVAVTLMMLTVALTAYFLVAHKIPAALSSKPMTVLVVGAHPDDLEIACGATIAKLTDSGHEVHGLIMSDGSQGGDPSLRPEEASNGAAFLKMKSLTHMPLTDGGLSGHMSEMITIIEHHVRQHKPEIILTHSINDVHQDHSAVHLAVLRAGRNHHSILCFESPSVTNDFTPTVFIDVSDYTDVKQTAIATHTSQMRKPYMSEEIVSGITAFRGRQARVHRAEGFEAVRLHLSQPAPFQAIEVGAADA